MRWIATPNRFKGALLRYFFGLFLLLSSHVASAQIELCNESKAFHYVGAVASWNAEVKEWVSRGWFNIEPRKCLKARVTPLDNPRVYLHASYWIPPPGRSGNDFLDILTGAMSVGTYGEITGNYSFCAQKKKFSLVGTRRCVSRGFDAVDAVEILLEEGVRGVSIELYDEGRYSFYPTR